MCVLCFFFYSAEGAHEGTIAKKTKVIRAKLDQNQLKNTYNCVYCKFSTKYRNSLKEHINYKHTKQIAYKCKLCNYQTYIHSNLKAHRKRHPIGKLKYTFFVQSLKVQWLIFEITVTSLAISNLRNNVLPNKTGISREGNIPPMLLHKKASDASGTYGWKGRSVGDVTLRFTT